MNRPGPAIRQTWRVQLLPLSLVVVASCGDAPLPAPRLTPPPSASASEVDAGAASAAPLPPRPPKPGPSLFVGRQQTWLVLASGRVASWGEEVDLRQPAPARPIVAASSQGIVGIRAARERDTQDSEYEVCLMKDAHGCPPLRPTTPPSQLDGAKRVDAHERSACGVMPDTTLRCVGPIATELVDYRADAPPRVRDFGKYPDIVELSVGEGHGCALRSSGEVMCWGHVGHGLLGDGRTSRRERAPVVGLNDAVRVSLDAWSKDGGCAIRSNGHVACWGSNARGQLGVKPSELVGRALAEDVPGVERAVKFVVDGRCVLRSDAQVQCWGAVPPYDPDRKPGADLGPFLVGVRDAVDADWVSQKGICVVTKRGTVECVGKTRSTLSRSPGAIAISSDIASLNTLVCVLLRGGLLRCWEYEAAESRTFAVPRDSVEVDALALERHWPGAHDAAYAVRTASGVVVAGVGIGNADGSEPPKASPRGLRVSSTLAAAHRGVARMAHGTLGYDRVTQDGHAVAFGDEVPDVTDAVDIASNGVATCVVRRGGTVECFGEERGASLGRGDVTYAAAPVKVTLPEPPLL